MTKKNTKHPPFRKGSKDYAYGPEQAELKSQIGTAMGEFKGVDTKTNLWADAENKLADLTTEYRNPFEDMQVNMQAARFQKDMAQQQQANILSMAQSSMGASGGAGLAQMLSNQNQIQAREISGGIAQQEQQIQMQQGQGAQWVQQQQYQAELAKGQGEMEAQKIELQGAADARDLTLQAKQGELAFLSGMMGASKANEDADFRKGENSDRRLKKNINLIGKSLSGLNIYSFEYKNLKHGEGLFQGVMSDEIPQEAVITRNGYDMVDYDMLDVEFKQL